MSRSTGKSRSKRLRGGALFIISMLMIGSAILRVGMQAGPAIAREAMHKPKLEEPLVEAEQAPTLVPADLQDLLSALQKREQILKKKEVMMQDRAKALEIAEKAIDQRLEALKSAEEQLAATLALADVASEDDLTRLTSVYEKMKPKQSAKLFEEMDPEFAAGFLARMRPEAAANVMAGLSPMAAYSISVVLAGRNASVPKE